jgi:hypothetical protein
MRSLALLCLVAGALTAFAQPSIEFTTAGKLAYSPDARGNQVIDFSSAGYGGGASLPIVPAKIFVPAGGGHDRERIQAALDLVSAMRPDAGGFRGAVLLSPGVFTIDTSLRIAASGVVLRGSGSGENGTVLRATGVSRRTLIEIAGHGDRIEIPGSRQTVTDAYAPVGATAITVADASGFHARDRIVVLRPSTAAWISLLRMDQFQGWRANERLHWLPGSRDIAWDRVVTGVEGNRVLFDAPLTTALDREYGGGFVYRYDAPGRIHHSGIENLRLVSDYDRARPKDEDHSWVAISLDHVENAWVRQVAALHFVAYAFLAQADAKWITIEDCDALDPIGEDAAYRGRAFHTAGQLTLFERCHSRRGRQDFTTGFAAAGPIVFLDCTSEESRNYSGPLDSWASGVLYDNVKIRGNALRLVNRGTDDQGAGWAAANSILWNCEATDIEVQNPPGAYNQSYGCRGSMPSNEKTASGNPYTDFGRGNPIEPASLYRQQLAERSAVAETLPIPASSAGVPPLSVAQLTAFLTREAAQKPAASGKPLRIENGRFTIGGQPAWTTRVAFQFYLGQTVPTLAARVGGAITRFTPGRTGTGLTDDLEAFAASLSPGAAFYHYYGLWYDRRRVNHNFDGSAERRTGDAWAPFLEQPWARSGQGKAWDGLSKYDLARFNPWFFERVKEFADICDRRGLILHHFFYLQHNLAETQAHYADFPWRPMNAIQATGLPERNPAANTFYDVANPVRRQLHQLYIRKCLNTLRDNTNVVYDLDPEYSAPLPFVRFWLDTIAQWEKENGKRVFIALQIPKAEIDTLLRDPVYRPMIAAMAFQGWNYRPDGTLFAIPAGVNKAPRELEPAILTEADLAALRQQIRDPQYLDTANIIYAPETQQAIRRLRQSTQPMRYRALREYCDQFPGLVVIGQNDEHPQLTAALEKSVPAALRARTKPAPLLRTHPDTAWSMAAPGETYLIYSMAGAPVELDLSADSGTYSVTWIGASGPQPGSQTIRGGTVVELAPPQTGQPWIAWLKRGTA